MKIRLLFVSLLFCSHVVFSQKEMKQETAEQFQNRFNKEFADSASSPLTKDDLAVFKQLDFYSISNKYTIEAEFVRIKKGKVFEMKTTTKRLPKYKVYGKIQFNFEGKQMELYVYQNQELKKRKGYED